MCNTAETGLVFLQTFRLIIERYLCFQGPSSDLIPRPSTSAAVVNESDRNIHASRKAVEVCEVCLYEME